MKKSSDELLSVVVDNCIPKVTMDNYQKHLGLSKPISLATVSLDKLHEKGLHNDDKRIANNFLAVNEQHRFNGFRYPKRKKEWLGGRIAAKYAVEKFLRGDISSSDCNWQAWQVIPDTQGRPHVKSTADLEIVLPAISISHSGNLAVAMATDNLCGIDIQQWTDTVVRVKDRFTDTQELNIFTNAAAFEPYDEKTLLTLLWAAKEAVRKTIPAAPLLGFKEMRLKRVIGKDQKIYQIEFTVLPGNQRKTKNPLPTEITATAMATKNYAVAFATVPTEKGY